jgi:transcriptional regulator with XRE-family HTH domain
MAAFDPDTYLGLRLRLLRQTRALTQRELAARLGVSHQAVHTLERGLTSWRVRDLLTLAKVLDFDPVTLLADLCAGAPLTAEAQVELLTRRITDLERQLAER